MTKGKLMVALENGKSVQDVFPYRTPGQDCDIVKVPTGLEFDHPSDIVYIPDLSLNEIKFWKRNLTEEEIDNVIGNCYTTNDFLNEAYGNRKCAEDLFSFVDWQHLDITDLRDCTDDDEAKELYGETWGEMEARWKSDVQNESDCK